MSIAIKISLPILLLLIVSLQVFSQCDTITVKGTVLSEKEKLPLPGINVRIKGTTRGTVTGENGQFNLKACIGDSLEISMVGYNNLSVSVLNDRPMEIVVKEDEGSLGELVLTSGITSRSVWSGSTVAARLGYNLESDSKNSADNIVGSATIAINPFLDRYLKAHWSIVGNIGNYLSSKSADDIDKDLGKVAQSNNGLAIGIEGIWETIKGYNEEIALRAFVNTGYRLNSFQNVGTDSATVSLSQWRSTAGLELEGFRFKNGGVLQIGAGINLSLFDSDAYQKTFGDRKKTMFSFDTSIILPISSNFGFMFQSTYSKSIKPIHQLGIIIKSSTK